MATKYHYRIVVVGGGTATGSDATFTTSVVPLGIAATITPGRVGVGGDATVVGKVTGTGFAGRQIVLQARPFPYTAPFTQLGNAEVVNPNGTFTFGVTSLQQNTEFRVVTVGAPSASSQVLVEGVAVRVSFGANVSRTPRGLRIRVHGTIAPGARDVQALLLKYVGHRWVLSTRLSVVAVNANLLAYHKTLRVRTGGRYRVLVRVTDGARLSAVSRTLKLTRPRH